MRLLLVLLGATAMIGLAVPAYADPDGDDAGFIAALQQTDIGFSNPGQAVASAKAVCTCLNNGESGLELIQDLKTHNPQITMDHAAKFAVLAAKYYCPQQLSKA
ncbi:DUF732 domain-containing protein [Mycobacterium haemophilum]|uniref:Glycine cleavage system P protein n=1 Tax=Mycobacterium haemophilum TaxID=29311 RepID=A0A0I9XZN2_9MYCO|nr:DUF732 domain-containing protein [Mycobacterium haemophilum]AKN17104.1 glycine cleavage system P protein [Mycobacterium haemophilum DSM 44634]KLO32662.1 glycine cleavage system P protein [Mycobacterium haemophilum]KLO36923.1 glycine cleavage system P protein [Mycobacterium haemophilum]KLO42943.1 glycine cleavage system P protein [Mycobacterium haemophilum]KLO55682.1 glycine cleavage system P protein [Mycobacterium haemophilum]